MWYVLTRGGTMNAYYVLFVSTLAVFFDSTRALSLSPAVTLQCGPNEMSTDCYNDRQLTCRNRIKGYDLYNSTDDCMKTGCVCLPEYYRHDNGTCVIKEDCSPPYCNEDEVFNSCGSSCLDTCEERGNTCQDCALRCVEGCFCIEGTFRASNGTCVKAEQCPPRTCDGPNEYFDECPPTCLDALDQSCDSVWTGVNCTETLECCTPQCRCKPGYYRDSEGLCISADDCMYDLHFDPERLSKTAEQYSNGNTTESP